MPLQSHIARALPTEVPQVIEPQWNISTANKEKYPKKCSNNCSDCVQRSSTKTNLRNSLT